MFVLNGLEVYVVSQRSGLFLEVSQDAVCVCLFVIGGTQVLVFYPVLPHVVKDPGQFVTRSYICLCSTETGVRAGVECSEGARTSCQTLSCQTKNVGSTVSVLTGLRTFKAAARDAVIRKDSEVMPNFLRRRGVKIAPKISYAG